VILFSTVRASAHAGGSDDHNLIGFLSDVRRLNVAITRPKFVLIVIGNNFLTLGELM
jgi:superfamily I DNA and/or RNA helicase